jgi:diguanylate cyclase (GGDEF)-like protein
MLFRRFPLGTRLTSFRNKIIGLTIIVVIGSQIATVSAVLIAAAREANDSAYVQLESGIETFRSVVENHTKVLEQTVRPLAEDDSFKRAIASKNIGLITAELESRANWVDADIALLLDPEGKMTAAAGNQLEQGMLFEKLTKKKRSAITVRNKTFEMMTLPVGKAGAIGWISMGYLVDDALANELAAITGLEMTFLTGLDSGRIRFLGSSLPRADRDLILNASLQIASGAEMYKSIEKLKSRYISNREYFFPEGDDIFVVVQKPLVEAMAGYETLRGTLLHAASTTLLVALALAFFLSRSVTHPVRTLLLAARRMRVGNYSKEISIKSRDELGELAQAFESMREGIAEREQRIYQQAQFDSLTALPNRLQGLELLRDAIRDASKRNKPVVVMTMHLQRFREIQSSLGHEIADEVLRQIAERLQRLLQDSCQLARLEGDQFLVIAPGRSAKSGLRLAEEIARNLDAGLSVRSVNVTLDACIGLCVCPEHGRQPDELLRRAAVAKNDAQHSQKRIRLYQNGREARHVRQLAILGDLRKAVQGDQLQLYLQPKIKLENTLVCGAEALLRWQHPELGNIPPAEFIPLAESAGSISMVTQWVLRRAIEQCRHWHEQGVELPIAVNLSGRDLMDDNLPRNIEKILKENNVPAGRLTLEITEEAVVHDIDQAAYVLNRLKQLGCHTSMDDFGTGYSSLAHLQMLAVAELKIDRTFVARLPDNPQNVAIVRSVIDLAHNLGMEVVAEGVETTAALRWLREEGCERAQGFYLSKPMPAGNFVRWLKSWDQLAIEDKDQQDPADSLILRPRLIN